MKEKEWLEKEEECEEGAITQLKEHVRKKDIEQAVLFKREETWKKKMRMCVEDIKGLLDILKVDYNQDIE